LKFSQMRGRWSVGGWVGRSSTYTSSYTDLIYSSSLRYERSAREVKINKVPEFYIIFATKSNKIPKFYTRHLPENARILHYVWPKKFFPGFCFFWGEGVGQPPSSVSYAYGWAPGPPPAKSGPGPRDELWSTY